MHKVFQKSLIYIILCLLVFPLIFENDATVYASETSSYIVIEESTNRILYASNEKTKLPMASTTKIMTAIVTIENSNLDDEVVITKEAQGVEGSSVYIKAGEKYTVRDLLYGLMLRSGNDCAVALAIHVAGSVQSFVKLMNEKALSVDAYDTNFTNPHGLHDDDHYTTAYDLAILTSNAYKNQTFREIVSTKRYKLKDGYIYNKNKLLSQFDGADGVKTGYTTKSGRCLVSSSTRQDMRVICVVLNCYDMWNKSMDLMNKAHNEYSMHKIISSDTIVYTNVIKGVQNKCECSVNKDVYYPLKQSEINDLEYENTVYDLYAPVYKGQNCGTLKVYLNKHLIFNENIYTINNIRKKSFLESL